MALKDNDALQARFDNIVHEEMEQGVGIVVETIQEVGIRRRTGNLLNSVRYVGEVEAMTHRIVVGAPYASYLNRGYGEFSLVPGRLGKTIPLRDATGKLIFRRVSTRPTSTGKNWTHPGYEGKNFVDIAKEKIYKNIVVRVEQFLNDIDPEDM